MSNVDPNEFTRIADILDAMNEADIGWPNHLYVSSNRIDLRYNTDGTDD